MKEKKICTLIAACLISTMLCACVRVSVESSSIEQSVTNNADELKTVEKLLKEELFSDSFAKSSGFNSVKNDVIEYYNYVRTAYEDSDKKTINTLIIDDSIDTLYVRITDKVDTYDKGKEDYKIMLKTAINVSKIRKELTGIEVLHSAGATEYEEGFLELGKVLDDVFEDFVHYEIEENSANKNDASQTIGKEYFSKIPDLETPESFLENAPFVFQHEDMFFYGLGKDMDKAQEDAISYLKYVMEQGYTLTQVDDTYDENGGFIAYYASKNNVIVSIMAVTYLDDGQYSGWLLCVTYL